MNKEYYLFCPKCGLKNINETDYCVSCGSLLLIREEKESQANKDDDLALIQEANTPKKSKRKSDKKPRIKIRKPRDPIFNIAILLLITAVVATVVFFISGSSLAKTLPIPLKKLFAKINNYSQTHLNLYHKKDSPQNAVDGSTTKDNKKTAKNTPEPEKKQIPKSYKQESLSIGNYTIAGIIESKGGKPSILLIKDNKRYIFTVGTKIDDGWSISKIHQSTIVLTRGKEIKSINLAFAAPSAGTKKIQENKDNRENSKTSSDGNKDDNKIHIKQEKPIDTTVSPMMNPSPQASVSPALHNTQPSASDNTKVTWPGTHSPQPIIWPGSSTPAPVIWPGGSPKPVR